MRNNPISWVILKSDTDQDNLNNIGINKPHRA